MKRQKRWKGEPKIFVYEGLIIKDEPQVVLVTHEDPSNQFGGWIVSRWELDETRGVLVREGLMYNRITVMDAPPEEEKPANPLRIIDQVEQEAERAGRKIKQIRIHQTIPWQRIYGIEYIYFNAEPKAEPKTPQDVVPEVNDVSAVVLNEDDYDGGDDPIA